MGGVVDVLTVAMGSGGVGTVLASSIRSWLTTRKSGTRIMITAGDRVIEVQAHAGKRDEVNSIIERLFDDFANDSGAGASPGAEATPRSGDEDRPVIERRESP